MALETSITLLERVLKHSIEEMKLCRTLGKDFRDSPFYEKFPQLLKEYARVAGRRAHDVVDRFVKELDPPYDAIPVLPKAYL